MLYQSETIDIPSPRFSGYSPEVASQKNPAISIVSPELGVFELSNATVVGGVDFVFINSVAIHHDMFIPAQHTFPAENYGIISVNHAANSMKLHVNHATVNIQRAINLIGQCSGNYAHWLTETLPKLPLIDACDEFQDWPVLIDDDLHPNIYASIDLINRKNREIIKVKRWWPVSLENLVMVSQPGYERYVPHDMHSKEAPAYVNVFSRPALQCLREVASISLKGRQDCKEKMIYLSRGKESGNIRQVDNNTEIEALMLEYGVRQIAPELMCFKDQVAACIDAEIIIAPIGASLANMIFAPLGCKIIVLSPYYDEASYFYYTNLAGVLRHELYYVLGPQGNVRQHPIHRNYTIDVDQLRMTLQQVMVRVST